MLRVELHTAVSGQHLLGEQDDLAGVVGHVFDGVQVMEGAALEVFRGR